MSNMKRAFYSERQREALGSQFPPGMVSIYARENGEEVLVTEVTDGRDSLWSDAEDLGEVVRWVRNLPA